MSKSPLTHLDAQGNAHMVDVSGKGESQRVAIARGHIVLARETLALIDEGRAKKGDVIATARIAGIMAAKRTHELIPLCHPLALSSVTVEIERANDGSGLDVSAKVGVTGRTGVEMEALTAVSVTCLTIYDMIKAVDRSATIDEIKLVEKSGGKSGMFRRS